MKKELIQYVEDNLIATKEFPKFKAGDTITVSYRIVEGVKERIQQFQGVVRRARIYYLRALTGKKARIKERRGK
ncbi:MAG: hypothetical protein CVU02_01955 [Bacteroidetes bacterium HGW-Bacteroidetes-19]|nr:MAG: hypothetical protein CVU02_01955 [Bacteroidetes bacterium HGW-Bacteroidetes-19]